MRRLKGLFKKEKEAEEREAESYRYADIKRENQLDREKVRELKAMYDAEQRMIKDRALERYLQAKEEASSEERRNAKIRRNTSLADELREDRRDVAEYERARMAYEEQQQRNRERLPERLSERLPSSERKTEVTRHGSGMSPWIKHVKAYQKKHGCSYKEAMKGAKKTY